MPHVALVPLVGVRVADPGLRALGSSYITSQHDCLLQYALRFVALPSGF